MPSGHILLRSIFACAVAFLSFRYYVSFRSAQNALPYKIVESPDRGKSLVATRDIMQGELILKETPLFIIEAGNFKDLGSHILSLILGLNSSSRSTFLELSHPPVPGSDIPVAIFQTNSVKIRGDTAGIFPLTARINHGCSKAFNSVSTWREQGFLVIHALRHIKKGQEILREYVNTRQSRKKRRFELYENYAFECSCSVCSLSSGDAGRSDTILSSMATIHAEFNKWERKNTDAGEAVRLAKRVWALGEKESYWSGRGRLAEDVVNIAAAHQDAKATKQWAELALEWYSYELGYDSREVELMRVLSSDPSKHAAWATREEMHVGGPDIILI